jgi:short-subunit dehydrogenase
MMPTGEIGGGPRVVILGALSAIAEAAAREWAAQGAHLMLLGRDAERLDMVAVDLRLRGAVVETMAIDLAGEDAGEPLGEIARRMSRIDIFLLVYGVLGDQQLAEADFLEARRVFATDFTSAACWCLAAANVLEQQRHGTLIVIGSVAGDRGRASNYVYGAAKAGLGVLVQGIAHRLYRTGARAVLIKPGLVDTPMTAVVSRAGLPWARPETIARIIVKAGGIGKGARPIVYAPGFWRPIMWVIRLMPSFIFHRTKL